MRFRSRELQAIRQQRSTRCPESRRGENEFWAGDAQRQDPFEGEWEQITAWMLANPERSSGDMFRELQRLSPGRYQPLQIRTLQRGMRKIRAQLLETWEEQWQEEVINGRMPETPTPLGRFLDRTYSNADWKRLKSSLKVSATYTNVYKGDEWGS